MSDSSSDRFHGSPQLPAVDPKDLKRIRGYIREVRAKLPRDRGEEPRLGVQANLIAERLSPHADAHVVFMRFALLEMLATQGLLAPWQHGDEMEDFIFEVFAAHPFHLGRSEAELNVEALLQHIRDSRPNP